MTTPRQILYIATTLGLSLGLLACGAPPRDLSGKYWGPANSGTVVTGFSSVEASDVSVTLQVNKGETESPEVLVTVMGMGGSTGAVECKGTASRSKDGEFEKLSVSGPKCDAGASMDKAYEACVYTSTSLTLREEVDGKFAMEKFEAKLNDGGPADVCRSATSVLSLSNISASGLHR